jgi:hypothetical protein
MNYEMYRELGQKNLLESSYLDDQGNGKGTTFLGKLIVSVVSESDCFKTYPLGSLVESLCSADDFRAHIVYAYTSVTANLS